MSEDRVVPSAVGRITFAGPDFPKSREDVDALRAENAELKAKLAPFVRVAESLVEVTDDKTKDLYMELSMWGAIVGCSEGLLLSDFAALLDAPSEV